MSRKVIYSILGAIVGAIAGAFLDLIVYLLLIGGASGDGASFGILGQAVILLPTLILLGGISCAIVGSRLAQKHSEQQPTNKPQ